MPASAEEVMSGSEEEDAGAPPMMHEDDDCNYWWDAKHTIPVEMKKGGGALRICAAAADVVHAR